MSEKAAGKAADSLSSRDGKLISNWYIAALATELGTSTPLARTIYDQRLVLFRGEDGRPITLPDRCLHRHAQLSLGTVAAGQIRCPYHGWTYDSAGKVRQMPADGPSCPKHNFVLKPLPTVEQDGCIWVWMGSDEPEAKTPPWRFPYHDQPGWTGYYMVTDFASEVTNLVENFMDVPHTVFVHAGWFRKRKQQQIPITIDTTGNSVLVTYAQSGDSIGYFRQILNPSNAPMRHTDQFILPNLTRVDYWFGSNRAFLITSQCTPVSALQTRVYTQINFRLGLANRLLYPFLRFYTRRVITQDVDIMANQAANLRLDPVTRFHHTEADFMHLAIEGMRQRAALHGMPAADAAGSVTKTTSRTLWV